MRYCVNSEYKVLLTKKYIIAELFGLVFFVAAIVQQMG